MRSVFNFERLDTWKKLLEKDIPYEDFMQERAENESRIEFDFERLVT